MLLYQIYVLENFLWTLFALCITLQVTIRYMIDVLDPVGTFLPFEKLKEIYLMDNIDPLSYIRARTVITKYITKYKEV